MKLKAAQNTPLSPLPTSSFPVSAVKYLPSYTYLLLRAFPFPLPRVRSFPSPGGLTSFFLSFICSIGLPWSDFLFSSGPLWLLGYPRAGGPLFSPIPNPLSPWTDTTLTTWQWTWNLKKKKMDSDKNEDAIRVQGRDTPVPVRGSSGRAGSPGPSSSDCSAPPVENQAGGGYNATGEGRGGNARGDESGNPFGSSRKVIRTPPTKSRARQNSLPEPLEKMEMVDLSSEDTDGVDESNRPTKKRKAGTPITGSIYRSITQGMAQSGLTLNKACNRVADLLTFCKQNANVHKEVKRTVAELDTMMGWAFAEYRKREDTMAKVQEENEARQKRIEALEEKIREIETGDTQGTTNRSGTRPTMVSIGTQTTRREVKPDTQTTVTREQIEEVKNYTDIKELLGKPWHKTLFRTAFLATGSPLKADKDADIVILEEEGGLASTNARNKDLYISYELRYPRLDEMVGKVATMVVNTSMLDRTGKTTMSEKLIHKLEIDNSPEDWFETLSDLRVKIGERVCGKLVMYPPSYDKGGRDTQKMSECIFRGTGVRCIIYPGKDLGEGTEGGNRENRPARKRTEALILSQEGKSYTDILRKVKENVKADSKAATGIRTIRKIKDGSLMIVLDEKEKEAIQELKLQVGKDLTIRQTGGADRPATIYIKDIDGITTKKDVAEAIMRETDASQDQLLISELRPFFGGNQATTVRLPKNIADKLVQKEKIRVGLSSCSVRGRVDVVQCYKCWGYGHRKQDCNRAGELENACLKCGQNGHKAKECDNGDYCILCKTTGHRVGSGGCPEHRKALARARLNQKKRRAY